MALDSITDPRNLGAIVRSAAAFGAHGVLIPERRVGRDDRRRLEDLGRRRGPDADRPGHQPEPHPARVRRRRAAPGRAGRAAPTPTSAEVDEISGPLVLVVGSEGAGLSRLVREACDTVAAIPIGADGGVPERRRRGRHRPLRDHPPPLTSRPAGARTGTAANLADSVNCLAGSAQPDQFRCEQIGHRDVATVAATAKRIGVPAPDQSQIDLERDWACAAADVDEQPNARVSSSRSA